MYIVTTHIEHISFLLESKCLCDLEIFSFLAKHFEMGGLVESTHSTAMEKDHIFIKGAITGG